MYNKGMYVEVNVVGYGGNDNRRFSYLADSSSGLVVGNIVMVKFGRKSSLGIIRALNTPAPKPPIKVQPIADILPIDPLPEHLLKLADWIIDYYVAPSSTVWQMLIPRNSTTRPRKAFKKIEYNTQPIVQLSSPQKSTFNDITQSTQASLLEGAMGSGKTEIYFHLISRQLASGRSSIMLMPEIFLTKQMIERARKHFGSKLIITHSSMTPAERRSFWVDCSARSKESGLVVLGPRSALFSPVHHLGLIVIDECHEQSYKQDSSPRYHAEMVAGKLASLTGAKLVLGSATPSISTRFLADAGKLQRLSLKQRAIASSHPDIKIIKKDKKSEIFTSQLTTAIKETLSNRKLVMLYLNRRGTAPIFVCNDCGQGFECPHCGVNLHFHADSMRLVCHVCGFKQAPPAKCPSCKCSNLRGVGIGTKAVAEKAAELFAGAKIVRIDRDSAEPKEFTKILDSINNNEVDIIIGTQIIGRGLDLENLHLVGMIDADYDLANIDYNSLERAFQLLSQTAGRAGRRKDRGEVIIQTKNPDNKFFELIISNDYESFYQSELALRKKYSYPPYSYLLKLECGFVSPELGRQKAQALIAKLRGKQSIAILGPVRSHPSIRGKKHLWSLIIKSRNRKILVDIASQLEPYWTINLDPFGLS